MQEQFSTRFPGMHSSWEALLLDKVAICLQMTFKPFLTLRSATRRFSAEIILEDFQAREGLLEGNAK